MRVTRLALLVAGLGALLSRDVRAQIPLRPTPAAPVASTDTAEDPYGRETPYGCFLGFLRAERDGHDEIAAQYLQLPKSGIGASPEDVAREVAHVFDQRFTGNPSSLSRSREGTIDDGLPPDQERAGTLVDGEGKTDVLLVRRAVADQELWFISLDTIREARRIYRELRSPAIERWLPAFLVHNHVAAMQLWQAIAAVVLLPVFFIGSAILVAAGLWLWRLVRRRTQVAAAIWTASARLPITLLLTLALHRASVSYVGLPLIYRLYYNRVIAVLLVLGTGWLLWRLADLLGSRFLARLLPSSASASYALFGLGRRILKVLVVIVTIMLAFAALGFNLTPTLAGLGIGGLAIAFAAQKSLENLFGGFSVLGGRVIRIGDICVIGPYQGEVEDINLYATLLRTYDRTLVQIPNGALATEKIENLSRRDKFWFHPTISLRYETTTEQLRGLLTSLREMLASDSRIEPETARVRFIRFGAYSLDVEIYAYVRVNRQVEFLAVQEELLFKVIEIIEASGTDVALPAQTSYISRDRALGAWEPEPPASGSPGKVPPPGPTDSKPR